MLDSLAYMTSGQGWLIVIVIILVLFGANRLPEIFKSLGSGLKEFKKGMNEDEEDKKNRQ